jgi:predicted aldo/keto reductase-like oxidoreductase
MSDKKKISRRQLLSIGGALGAAAVVGPVLGPAPVGAEEKAKGDQESLPQVPRRVLGKTEKTIPILVMGGAMKLDPRFDPKLAECLRFGVNYIDAADCYSNGMCEVAVGNFMKRADVRDEVWITSKSDQHDPAGFEKTLDMSLEKLQTDRVELYYLHALKNPAVITDDLRKKVEKLKKSGKMLHFGFSCHHENVAELLHLAAKTPWIESVMFRYNFRKYGDKELNEAIDAAHKAGVGLIAMKTQSSEASFADAWKKFEQTGKWTKHQAVMKAVWADERIASAVSHMDTFEKLRQNIAAALDRTELSSMEWDSLRRYDRETRHLACEGCDHHCNPAVDAPVRIGDTMRYLMYHDTYGERAKARMLFRELPAEAQKIAGVDFTGATRACPHGIDVAAHMKRAVEVLA